VLYDFVHEELYLKITIFWLFPDKRNYDVVKDVHVLRSYALREYKDAAKRAGLTCRVYWDFSVKKKSGARPQLVCGRLADVFCALFFFGLHEFVHLLCFFCDLGLDFLDFFV